MINQANPPGTSKPTNNHQLATNNPPGKKPSHHQANPPQHRPATTKKNPQKTTNDLTVVDLEIHQPWQQATTPTDREEGDGEKIEK